MKKKIIGVVAIIVLEALLFGCGAQEPSEPVENVMKHLQNNELSEINQYFYTDSTEGTEENEQVQEDSGISDSQLSIIWDALTECAEQNAQYIRYEIVDSVVNGDDATVKLEVTYKNVGPVIKLAFSDLINQSISSAFSSAFIGSGEMDDDDLTAIFIASFEKAKENVAIIDKTDTLEVHCKNVGKEWKICNPEVLRNIYYGNVVNSLESMFSESEDTEDEESTPEGENTDLATQTDLPSNEEDADTSAGTELGQNISYFKDNGMKETIMSFVYWDEADEMTLDFTYKGEDTEGNYVGEFEICISEYNADTGENDSVTGTGVFTEDTNGNGTVTLDNGNMSDYSIYWDEDHYAIVINFDGETMDLLEADWAYNNVG